MLSGIRMGLLASSLSALASFCGVAAYASTTISADRVAQAVGRLDEVATDIFARSGIPGMAVAVVHQGRTVYAKGFGVRKIGENEPVDPHTVFQIASLSKPVGATVVATQISKGVVSWDTPVTRHLPWFALSDPQATAQVTIGDLYSHQSGLPDHAGDDLEDLGYGRRQILERLRHLPLEPLRSQYAYTNFGLTAAALAVSSAAGTEWEKLSEEVLYLPLGMTATSSRHSDFLARTNRATPHIRGGAGFVPGPQRQPDAQTPAGGVSSNVLDIAKWMNMVLDQGVVNGQRLIDRDALTPALSPQVMTAPPSENNRHGGHYGYGFNVSTTPAGNRLLGHSGAFFMGAATSFSLLPAADTGIVVLTNALPVGAAEALCLTYVDLVQHGRVDRNWLDFLGPVFDAMLAPVGKFAGQPFLVGPDAALPLAEYTGTFANDYLGAVDVIQRSRQLVLSMPPHKREFPLTHWNGNIFVFEPEGEMATPGSRSSVTFVAGQDGSIQSLEIEFYEKDGVGRLVRQ
ncbi:MAG TPA: serine hydrolase [Pusillimonas sp.]|uniref:serine hydrolase n=1 Tax=Pusillimonas sp. TaxID=3040095 RepID=UPI002B4ADACE|nr:serine hydrolase [Pusillimonas sp.]HLU20308.1 serine hydrolase [Pusillimonas sp.]